MKNFDILKIFAYLMGANINVVTLVFLARFSEIKLLELYPNSLWWKPIIWLLCVFISLAGYVSLWKVIKSADKPPSGGDK